MPLTHSIPSWANNRIGYQCFVDSFAKGNDSTCEKESLYPPFVYQRPTRLLDWSEPFPEYGRGYAFYGGNLNGISQAIGRYLADFGIDLLYLTPIFKAESNHKYDTLDYRAIDPQFGTFEDFHNLVALCHSRGMKLILDGVFNHTGSHHDWFIEASKGMHPFDTYYKKNEQGHFLKWAGIETLPLLNHENTDVQDYFYHSDQGIVPFWLGQGADGWRLDVAEGLGKKVIRVIKASMTSRFTDKALYGEVIESYGKEWLGPDLLDGVMNYSFLGNTVNFLKNKITGEEFLFELHKMASEYPPEYLAASWNIISTHDTHRMIYEVDGNENLFKIAVALQFTYPGIPMIYYGDELGLMPGEKDMSNRQGLDWQRVDMLKLKCREPWKSVQPMDWKRINHYSSFHFYYRHLIWMRKNDPVWTLGEFIPLYADKDIVSFLRVHGERAALVVLNRGNTKEIELRLPERIRAVKPLLRGMHGPLAEIRLSGPVLRLSVYSQNTYLFVS